jgi:hypothetical protein
MLKLVLILTLFANLPHAVAGDDRRGCSLTLVGGTTADTSLKSIRSEQISEQAWLRIQRSIRNQIIDGDLTLTDLTQPKIQIAVSQNTGRSLVVLETQAGQLQYFSLAGRQMWVPDMRSFLTRWLPFFLFKTDILTLEDDRLIKVTSDCETGHECFNAYICKSEEARTLRLLQRTIHP